MKTEASDVEAAVLGKEGEPSGQASPPEPAIPALRWVSRALVLIACMVCAKHAAKALRGRVDAEGWSYGHLAGPQLWRGVCRGGRAQSPIDLDPSGSHAHHAGPDVPLQHLWLPSRANVTDSGHGTFVVTFEHEIQTLIAGSPFTLRQIHFHVPSEHTVQGTSHVMEAHCVHEAVDDGTVAVVGVLLEEGPKANAFVQAALDQAKNGAATLDTRGGGAIDPRALLPVDSAAAAYVGSLTTPPCTQGVRWFVYLQPVLVSAGQVLQFMRYVGQSSGLERGIYLNFRNTQPLNDRTVDFYGPGVGA